MKYSQDMKRTWKIIKSLINSSQGTHAAEILKIDGKMVKDPMEIAHNFNKFLLQVLVRP